MKRRIIIFLGSAGLLGLCLLQIILSPDRMQEPAVRSSIPAPKTADSFPSAADHFNPIVQAPAIPAATQPALSGPPLPARAPATDEYDVLLQDLRPHLANDPRMEDILRNRLWLALDHLNSPLLGSLGLNPGEIGKLKALAAENLIAAAERTTPESSFALEVQLDAELSRQRDEFDAQVHQLLGDARFAVYTAAREDLAQFNRLKFLNPNEPLTDGQTGDVLAVIATERETVNAAAASLWAQDGIDPASATAEQQAGWAAQIQQLIDQRVYARLSTVLSPDRLAAWSELPAESPKLLP